MAPLQTATVGRCLQASTGAGDGQPDGSPCEPCGWIWAAGSRRAALRESAAFYGMSPGWSTCKTTHRLRLRRECVARPVVPAQVWPTRPWPRRLPVRPTTGFG